MVHLTIGKLNAAFAINQFIYMKLLQLNHKLRKIILTPRRDTYEAVHIVALSLPSESW